MKYLKRLWQIAPRILRSLLITFLVITMAGFTTAALGAKSQSLPGIPPATSLPPQPSDTGLMAQALPHSYSIPSACSVPIIPAIITPEEVELRQYQVNFAKFIEQGADVGYQAGVVYRPDVLAIQRFRLDCEIMLLRAQQILAAQDAANAEDRVEPIFDTTVTPKEVELRKSQFEIAKQIDNTEVVAQQEGVGTPDQLWSARRNRIDADILLTQATIQLRMQNELQDRQQITENRQQIAEDEQQIIEEGL